MIDEIPIFNIFIELNDSEYCSLKNFDSKVKI